MSAKIFAENFPLSLYSKREKLKLDLVPIRNFYKNLKKENYFKESLKAKLDDYFYSFEKGSDFGVQTTFIALWIVKKWSFNDLIEIIHSAHFVFPETKQIEVCIPPLKHLIHKFEKLGFKIKGYQLYGGVDKTLSLLSDTCLEGDITICKKSDVSTTKLAKLMFLSHTTSKSSFAKKSNLKGHLGYLKMCDEKGYEVFVLKTKGRLVGTITPIKSNWGIGHIMDISIDPKFKGQGYSKLLYLKAMEYFKSLNIEIFSGCSGSIEVLNYSNKIKREKCGVFMSLDVN